MKILKEEYNKDKFNFTEKGDWDNEPDLLIYLVDGLYCKIARNGSGALCGYIAIDPRSIFYKEPYNSEKYYDLEVNGGLTYSDLDKEGVYWVGFDCSHSGDYLPSYSIFGSYGIYKDIDFVKAEIIKMLDFVYPAKHRLLIKINQF